MNCPCEKCICLPVCRHKKYSRLFTDCSLIKEYMTCLAPIRDWDRIYHLEKIIKPTRWSFINKEWWPGPLIMNKNK